MGADILHPENNYERNFLLVKKFGANPITIIIPVLLLLKIICIGYLSFTRNEMFELTLLKLITTKINPEMEIQAAESSVMIISCIFSLFFIFAFFSFYFSCKDPSYESVPEFSLSVTYGWSMVQLVLYSLCFAATAFFLILFIVKPASEFESFGNLLGMSVRDLESYKISIILAITLLAAIFAVLVWFSQSQAAFIKSIKVTLINSVARNTGAHTFGVFCMSLAVAMLFIAGVMTFMYYCYKDAFNGFGISVEKSYVYTSIILSFLRGLVPFFTAIFAFIYTETVDAANTIGTVYYNDIETYGTAQDPNMARVQAASEARKKKIASGSNNNFQ